MINEPIMRRGLSPEGRMIRQRHQSSLLNDEFGVTSQPIHRKIEKDFLKENVKRLKEIQAKCRVHESKPKSGNCPIKAIREKSQLLPPFQINKDKSSSAIKERGGSAHSDYFSLTDEAQDESNDETLSYKNNVLSNEGIGNLIPNKNLESCELFEIGASNRSQEDLSVQTRPISVNSCLSANSLNSNNIPDPSLLGLSKSSNVIAIKNCGGYPGLHKDGGKICDLIERIKNKKPACDTQTRNVWRDIEKQHRTLLGYEENFSVCTPRSCIDSRRSNALLRVKKQPNSININRSQSLDRMGNHKRSIGMHHPNSNTYLANSQSTSNISMKSELCESNDKFENKLCPLLRESSALSASNHPIVHSESLPELGHYQKLDNHTGALSPTTFKVNKQSEIINIMPRSQALDLDENSDFHQFSDQNISNIGPSMQKLPQEVEHVKTRTHFLEDLKGNSTFTPIITKKESSAPMYKQNILAKQRSLFLRSKSSSNLRITGEPPPTYKRGHIPKYLLARKVENQRQLEAAAAVDPFCPPGHTPLPDHERRNTLQLLNKGQSDVIQQLSLLPIAQDTLRLRKLKQELEAKLNQIEEGIQIFSQPKVYVVNDE